MSVGSVIAERVEDRGITFAELARRVGMNGEVMRRVCKGEAMPKGDQLVRICVELDLDIKDFASHEATA